MLGDSCVWNYFECCLGSFALGESQAPGSRGKVDSVKRQQQCERERDHGDRPAPKLASGMRGLFLNTRHWPPVETLFRLSPLFGSV